MTLRQLLERYHAIGNEEVRPDTLDTWRTSRRYRARMAAVQKELRSRTLEEWLANIDDEHRSDPETAERAAARMRWIYVDNGRYEPQPPPPRVAGLRELTADELIQRFVALAIEEDETTEGFEDVDRIYWLIDEVLLELDARSSDERRILLPLLTHPHIAVRARAADATREIAPDLSRSRSLAIDDPEWSPNLTQADCTKVRPGGAKNLRR